MTCPPLFARARVAALLLLALAALLLAPLASAQPDPVAAATARLVTAEREVRAVDRALNDARDRATRDALRERVDAAREDAAAAADQLADQLELIDARAAQLGPASASDAPDLAAQRARLARQRTAIDSNGKRGRLIVVEAQQLVDEINQSEAEQFSQTIAAHVPSPLSPGFWAAVLQSAPRDLRRISGFVAQGRRQIAAGRGDTWPWPALLGAIVALALIGPGRAATHRVGLRFLIDDAPGHRVRRSGNAIWRVLVGTLTPLLASVALIQGLRWSGLVPSAWSAIADTFVAAVTFAGFTASVTGALLMRNQPSWRVAPIADDVARQLRPFSWLLAAVAFLAIMVDSFNRAVGASAAALSATQAIVALLHVALLIAALVALGRLRAARAEEEQAPARAGLGAAALVAWAVVVVATVALLLGYLGLARFAVSIVAWGLVLGSATFLLMAAIDDVATTVFAREGGVGRTLSRALGVRAALIEQFGVLASGVLRVVLALTAFGLLFSPFSGGGGIGALIARVGSLAQGIEIGGIAVSPGTILRGVVVLFVGLALVRAFMRWLEQRYLPATDLDGSGRNSVSLVARYVGVALAVIWALASLGIGVERIALLLSALSVGIGFGLQAITSNFVSGLILLAERPIKIGDWIRVGTDEGDVKRISVRSTEIGLADHSTLIVPNSELITKSVLNKTLASPLGRIQVQFSVPLESDADKVRAIVAQTFGEESAILDDPAPAIFIDSIADGRIFFNCFAHVPSPRAAYGARSAVFTVLLRRFREEGIELGTVPQRLELLSADPARAGNWKESLPPG
ncbi:DUF3772 domain-containing protein [Sphingomonas sp. BK235]|uniref:DUF3772 domain-containing protein n=1 Tax=Sphingomonas sp. BK235 TaxID=2512131 RepID=UPI0010467FA5|nr:DUF3772 domain-containing protein [Sphingomonas sp. BK235]TCP32899.1 small-conductance mechanosensitive channel [Sphingomonas sp. BK235]